MSQRMTARLLGTDRPQDLAALAGLFGLFLVVDRWTQLLASLSLADIGEPTLVLASLGNRWWAFLPLVPLVAAGVRFYPARLLCRWNDLQHGARLRGLAGVLIAMLVWQGALYDVNYVAGQIHTADRVLVVLLGLAAGIRPVLLLPFVIQIRIVTEQFRHPFDAAPTYFVEEILIFGLVALIALHVFTVVTGWNHTAPVLMLLGAAVASGFFSAGWGHFRLGWLDTDTLANLPLAGYTTGWLRYGDGTVARFLSEVFRVLDRPVMIAVLVIELGAVVVLVNRRLTVLWLVLTLGFHALVFAAIGLWPLGWVVITIALVRLLLDGTLDDWHLANATPARIAMTVLATTVFAPLLFHPPDRAWLDAPVSYGYDIEATGESGDVYHVPLSAFAPLDHALALNQLELAPASAASGAYGEVDDPEQLTDLSSLTTMGQLRAYERLLDQPTDRVKSEELVRAFMQHANEGERPLLLRLGPPSRFWTSRGEPEFNFDEPLTRVEVWRVRSIHNIDADADADGEGEGEGEPIEQSQLVLVLELDEFGQIVVSDETTPPEPG